MSTHSSWFQRYSGYIAIAGTFIVCAIYVVYGVLITKYIPSSQERGLFGDMYGGLNGFFASVTMLIAIIAIYLQHEEIKLQREDLSIQASQAELERKQMMQHAYDQIQIDSANQKAAMVAAIRVVFELLESDAIRKSWQVIGSYEFKKKTTSQVTSHEREAMEHICRVCDVIGFMAKQELVNKSHIVAQWGGRIYALWLAIEPHRAIFETAGEYRGFEYLAAEFSSSG